MSNGPIDYGSGYFFESQKGISDRRAARGLDQVRANSTSSSSGNSSDTDGLISSIVGFALKLAYYAVVHGLPVLLRIAWEMAKALFRLIGWFLSRR